MDSFLGYSGLREETVLLETAEPLNATTIVLEETVRGRAAPPRPSHLH